MGVVTPGYHLKSAKDLPHLRRRLKGAGARKEITAELNLTSMIDLFSVIILFLISSFSATGEILMVNKAIHLPVANNGRELARAPIVTVQADKVTLEGAPVGDNAGIEAKLEETDWELPHLTERLDAYKKFFEGVHPEVKFPAEVIVQADRKLPFLYLKRVMYTLTKHGYTNINLAVRGEAHPGGILQAPGNPAGR